jgi:IS1 family transposase
VANRLKAVERLQILHLLVQGNSLRSTARLTGSRIRTILSHLVSADEHCRELMDLFMRNLQLDHLKLDEIPTFRLEKQGKLTTTERANQLIGDQYLFIALGQPTKLIPSYVLGKRRRIRGVNDVSAICTSHVGRNNVTIRQCCKRFTRLTYAFSKKRANLFAAISLHVAYYNICRRHSSLRITPAMAAGVSNTLWSLGDLSHSGAA